MDCQNTNGSKFKLKHPQLITNLPFDQRPIVWFVIKQQNCQSGLPQDNELNTNQSLSEIQNFLVENISRQQSISVFPNPFEDKINIESMQNDEIVITTISGLTVFKSKISEGTQTILLPNVSQGVYFLTFNNQQRTFKIIKQ